MSRRFQYKNIYNDPILGKFINYLMKGGKKSIAEKLIYKTFKILKLKFKKNPLKVFNTAIKNGKPYIGVLNLRTRGKTFNIPRPLTPKKQLFLVMKWLIQTASERNEKTFSLKLAHELLNLSKKQGKVMKYRKDLHKLAQRNRSYTFFKFK